MPSHAQPGQRAGVTTAPRDILMSYQAVRHGNGVLDAANAYDGANASHEDELRPGCILAQITASKLWVPCKRTTANGAGSSSASLTVVNATHFKAGDAITIGGTSGVISSISYSSNVITLTAAKTWSDGDAVYVNDGSGIARGILNEFVKLKDEDGVARAKSFGQMVVAGLVNPDLCLGDLAAIRAASGMYLNGIQWGDYQGLV